MKKQEGITLIALVITIIVLLILAGVTIAMLTGENGLLTRASSTQTAVEEGKARDVVSLAINEVKIDILDPTVTDNSKKVMSAANVVAKINAKPNQLEGTVAASGSNITITGTDTTITVALTISGDNATIASVTTTDN